MLRIKLHNRPPSCLFSIASLLSLAICLLVPAASAFADINNTRLDAWGTQEVASGGWMNNEGVPIYSNGSNASNQSGVYDNVTNINNVSTEAGQEWQCVEMVNRLWLTEGWSTATWYGNGTDLYGAASSPTGAVSEGYNSVSYIEPGDVISLNTLGGTGGEPGHAGIVSTVTKSGSSYSVVVANQNTAVVYFTATLTGSTLTLPTGWNSSYGVNGVIHSPTRIMIIDGSGHAYSEDFLGNSWTTQMTNYGVSAIAVGGSGRMMVMTSTGAVYEKDYPTQNWTNVISSGAQAIAVGGNGTMMVIDSAGNVYAMDYLSQGWQEEYGSGGAKAIAVGGNASSGDGIQMIIDSSGNAWSNTGIGTSWGNEVTGAKAIAVGGSGRMMVINSANDVYAEDSINSWYRETTLGGYTKIAAGGGGRQMLIDTSNTAYYQDSIGTSWTSANATGATAIAVGSNGRMMFINTSGAAWGKDHPGDVWTRLTLDGGAASISINNE